MKELFFTGVLLAIPVVAFTILIYLFGHGVMSVFNDWRLSRELDQLRKEAAVRRADQLPDSSASAQPSAPLPSAAQDDRLAGHTDASVSSENHPVFDLNDYT